MRHGLERQRCTIRLKQYDYSSTGAYFVTICAHGKQSLFEDPTLKKIAEQTWYRQQERFPNISLDSFVVMPNHVHFIVWLNLVGAPLAGAHGVAVRAGASPAPTTLLGAPLAAARGHASVRAGANPTVVRAEASPDLTLGDVVGVFKSIVATKWLKWLKWNAPHRSGRVWQRNYYDRIIRNDQELDRIREYVHLNPLKWEFDRENPHCLANHDYQREWGWLEAQQIAAWQRQPFSVSGRESC